MKYFLLISITALFALPVQAHNTYSVQAADGLGRETLTIITGIQWRE